MGETAGFSGWIPSNGWFGWWPSSVLRAWSDQRWF